MKDPEVPASHIDLNNNVSTVFVAFAGHNGIQIHRTATSYGRPDAEARF
jgi:deferrochelatase/peroxidase EfeB